MPRPLTITAKNQEVDLGDEIVSGAGQVDTNGLLDGHSISYIELVPDDTTIPTTSGTIEPMNAKIVDANNNEVTSYYTITYENGTLTVYQPPEPVQRDVTFLVVNGSWNDEMTADKPVTLNGYEGDTLKLADGQIPAVGTKPDDGYKAGSWDTTPTTNTAFEAGSATTYTLCNLEKR